MGAKPTGWEPLGEHPKSSTSPRLASSSPSSTTTTLVRLFLDTGARRAEVADLTLDEVDFDTDVILLIGKG